MNVIKPFIVSIIIAGLLTFFMSGYTEKIHYKDYKDALSALINISSIIFAIIGAWIAIIYPKSIARTFNPSDPIEKLKENEEDADYLSMLIRIVLISAFVLMSVLLMQILFPILRSVDYLSIDKDVVKLCAFFSIVLLTSLQVLAVFRVIKMNFTFLERLRRKNHKESLKSIIGD